MRPSDWLPLLGDIADRADEIALAFFGTRRLRVEQKPDASPVTEADRAIETMARELLRKRQPAMGMLGEEQGEVAGATGTRLIITLLYELRRRKKKYGLATACIGGGQGIAVIVEALN